MNFPQRKISSIKTASVILGFVSLAIPLIAQDNLQVATYNFTSFGSDEKIITPVLKENTPEEFQKHPEFGIRPYRTPCSDCVELVQKRKLFSRYFIESDDPSLFYVQQSYFQLHYKDKNGFLRTADPRLRPETNNPGIYHARNQPVPTSFNKNLHETAIEVGDFSFEFNNKLRLYWISDNENHINESAVNFNQSTVGESGVMTVDAWNNIDIRQVFDLGSVETDFIIKEPLEFPAGAQWLVFEDLLKLPKNHTVERASNGILSPEGYWTGDLYVKEDGYPLIKYKKSLYHDAFGAGIYGSYAIEKRDEDYAIKVMVPVSFLMDPNLKYPVNIDPLVWGRDSVGHFFASGFYANPLTFTSQPGTCDWTITDTVPGKCELVNAIIDVEYKNPTAFCAPQPDPICKFSDVRQWVQGPCFNFGPLACNPALPPYVGTCTTDPTKVPGASALSEPLLVTCIPPQCPDYYLDFTLQNQTRQCQETCDSNCAAGSFFAVTVQGRTIENVVNAAMSNGNVLTIFDTICAGTPVNLISFPDYGVPPYTYSWTPGGMTDSVPVVYPEVTTTYFGTAIDTCGNPATNSVKINVIPSPVAGAGEDTSRCDGDSPFVIGGNPTGPSGSQFHWTSSPPAAVNFLSDTTASNPLLSIPAGDTGTYRFIVEVEGSRCSRYDSLKVTVAPIPSPVIMADTLRVCEGDTVALSVTQPYAQYQWSTSETTQSIKVTQSGSYIVTVTDSVGCSGSANSPQVVVIPELSFSITAIPDSDVELGNSVTLGADIDLQGPQVRDYVWEPNNFITCTDCEAPMVTPLDDQLYYLTVVSADSCISTDSLLIRVIPPESYAIPSAFSPNNDGKNDRFFILKASGVTVKEFKIFNRWGQMLHNEVVPWDGTFNDEFQEMGAYTYLFVLQFFEGKQANVSGSVTLVR